MILVWGFRARFKTMWEGMFHCPGEGGDRPARLQEAKRWFTLFWIPLIPGKVLGRFVECSSCGRTYDERILTSPTDSQVADTLTTAVRVAVATMVMADGQVHPNERTVALQVIQRHAGADYTEQHLDVDLQQGHGRQMTDVLLDISGNTNEHGKEALLTGLLAVAAADGTVDEEERRQLQSAGLALGMSPAHITGVLSADSLRR